ncbi:MAG TPA: hypothetical protein VEF04_02240, partial [Blastocatellia bacterium]|nr:hypothetical protein [Blastocatellia bacterium]
EQSQRTVHEFVADQSIANSLQSIQTSVEQVVSLTRQIEVATSEQSAGAEEIGRAMQDLSKLTQEINAATTEQSSGAAEIVQTMVQMSQAMENSALSAKQMKEMAALLSRQSESLRAIVSSFDIGASNKQVVSSKNAVCEVSF